MTTNIENEIDRIDRFLDILRCPLSGERLFLERDVLTTSGGVRQYRVNPAGIPLFAESFLSPSAEVQRDHYNRIAAAYTANLEYPHTQEYLAYLDQVTLDAIGDGELGAVAELCCGRGEALKLFGLRARRYVGIDVSENMLQSMLKLHNHPNAIFLQADATRVPLAQDSVDTVVMLGGIHHVPARAQLFEEVARILKPGGRFLYREPVSDFVLWRALRAIIYRISPMLNHATERPLLYDETVPVLERAGLKTGLYKSHLLLGFCLFSTSAVLFLSRLL